MKTTKKRRHRNALPPWSENKSAEEDGMEPNSNFKSDNTSAGSMGVVATPTRSPSLRRAAVPRQLADSMTAPALSDSFQEEDAIQDFTTRPDSMSDSSGGGGWEVVPVRTRQRRSDFDLQRTSSSPLKARNDDLSNLRTRRISSGTTSTVKTSPLSLSTSKARPEMDLNWRKTIENFAGSGKTPDFRELLTKDAKLRKHVGGEEGLDPRSSVTGPLIKDGESLDDIEDGDIVQHEGVHLFDEGKAPPPEPNTRLEARPNGKVALIKTRLFVVLKKDGHETKEVQICTFHGKSMAKVFPENRYRYAHLRPPHIPKADLKVLDRQNPVFEIAKAYQGWKFSDAMVVNLGEPIHRNLRSNVVSRVGRMEPKSFVKLKTVVEQRSREFAAKL
ncbi:hypothetical protein B0A48_10446 [Cryoendolithus antarcticus]|uniref:Uncharacterized protein n=1 Tax=Cryoendolithus antarcticus TaxID=1507870 RepID=A0A1V8SXB6_9PEZI|nr:hypothetical protein B0A48_10446 [Cryoendolithus antarcticus]